MSVMDQRPNHRPRSKSGFSFKSEKSGTSHKKKDSLQETHEEKRKVHMSETTKANPNAAMNEAQPLAAALEKPTLQSLRSFQHTDAHGNAIAEPDLSNPTRPRWERPLDTIRSFEAAIDSEYKRRQSIMRTESSPEMNGYASRRSSYYAGHDNNQNSRYSQVGGYYGGRGGARDSYIDNNYGQPSMAGPSRSRYSQRLQSDPALNQYNQPHAVYPTQVYQRSRDTINTGSNGSQSEPWTNSTDPSSENSSIERATPVAKPDLGEQYGFNGFGAAPPILEEYGYNSGPPYEQSNGGYPSMNGNHSNGTYNQPRHNGAAPPVPPHNDAQNRGPIRLGAGNQQPLAHSTGNAAPPRPPLKGNDSDKRKSWFKRRFSKD